MIRLNNMFVKKGIENFTNVYIDTFKCSLIAANASQKLVISVDGLRLRKILSESNHIYEYKYGEGTAEMSLMIKIGGPVEEVRSTKEKLGSVGVCFSMERGDNSSKRSSSEYYFNSSPNSYSDTVKMDSNRYEKFNTISSDDQDLLSERRMSEEGKDSPNSSEHKKSGLGSLFNIFRKKKESYSRSSGLLMLNSYSQHKGVLQTTLPVILNLNEGMVDRISKYFTISASQNQQHSLKVSSNIKEALEIHINFKNPAVHLNFYGPRSNTVFYTDNRGYQALRETEFLNKLSNLHQTLSSAFAVNQPLQLSKVSVDKCLSHLIEVNARIANKIVTNEYTTKTIGFAFRNFINRKPNSRYAEIGCFEFRPKIKKLINFFLELNFDFNTHIEFIASFYKSYLGAISRLESLIVSYFSYRNKEIRINSFYVFLLRAFAFEVEELVGDFKRVLLELLSASNYSAMDKQNDVMIKQKAFYEWFARYNNIPADFCDKTEFDLRDTRLKDLVAEVIAVRCKNLNFLRTELVHELKHLKGLDK